MKFTDDDRAIAYGLLQACCIPRDRLPYTPEFESLYDEFLRLSGRQIDRCVFWRFLASAAKRGGLARHRAKPAGNSVPRDS